jgi:hypothetical protein
VTAPGDRPATVHGLTGTADAGAFLARLTRLEPAAVVRLRPVPGADRTQLWARLPWGVLVTRTVDGPGPADATVTARDLLAELARGGAALPARRDADWRWPLPGSAGRLVETLPGDAVRRIALAAAATLRTAEARGVGGRAVGQRALRDALLDHVAVVVDGPVADGGPTGPGDDGPPATGGQRVEVPQRLVQAVVRMAFLGAPTADDDRVGVRRAPRWTGLSAPYGTAWLADSGQMAIISTRHRPNG